MGHFDDLCHLNRETEEKRAEAARILQDEAARLIEYYEEWLELPSMYWTDKSGDSHPYVETGLPSGRAADFSPLSVRGIATAPDNVFRMAVRTWIDSFDVGYPVSVVIDLQLFSVGDGGLSLIVRVEDDAPIKVFIDKSNDEVWDPVVKSMKKHIASHLKKRRPAAFL
ncbi:Uncharacterised protein [Edwardsiella tarda]|uniref:Uncharacterized protein n=1 Tax=Edwardsiella tarda ATCC 15947 = NBRC 105688 TaxID=667121 RepID=A0AC61THW4_EDWTA|nr:hypothetical protein [Edwardsiella tarda]UAL56657.1 hypothetical protein K8O98_01370 [Edwardsiella tarda]UCQ00289.1 hypothetical protein DCL27_00300 [Edwardsiella tarda ATCC 15947 = NBRC 105688]STD27883.1 Uncharacterised protein [Edwardsiella tarda]